MSKDSSLKEMLRRWRALREQGKPLSAEELSAGCPELVDVVRGEEG